MVGWVGDVTSASLTGDHPPSGYDRWFWCWDDEEELELEEQDEEEGEKEDEEEEDEKGDEEEEWRGSWYKTISDNLQDQRVTKY